ncbi:MAG TPA: TonB family protein, partial [Elusimicrobiales bacterium]|nr:TonB family protein [Elusimicrobiales bacterium]
MTQFYIYSTGIHFILAVVFFVFLKPFSGMPSVQQTFTIDLVGGVQTIIDQTVAQEQSAKETSKAQPDKISSDDIVLSDKKQKKAEKISLSAPSILQDKTQEVTELPVPSVTSEGGVKAEFPDFPYPWYITQVRASLWNEWSSRMPRNSAVTCVAVFRVQKDGNIKGLRVEKSSGNSLFDFAATASVQNSTPFPPLPDNYANKELT